MGIEIIKITVNPGNFDVLARVTYEKGGKANTSEETYTLVFNSRLRWHPYHIVKLIAERMFDKKGNERKYFGRELFTHLEGDEEYFKRKVYYLWKSSTYNSRIGYNAIFRLYNRGALVTNKTFRAAFASALFQKDGGKKIDKSHYWLGDYRKTRIALKTAGSESPLLTDLKQYVNYHYPLHKNFTGRVDERKLLTDWVFKHGEPLFMCIGLGGMGKSSLAWYWLQEDIINQKTQLDGIFWWTFYEKDSSFDSFINKLLGFINNTEADSTLSLRERIETILRNLRNKRYLIILDGVERLLRYYSRIDAPYIVDKSHAESDNQSFRSFADFQIGNFIQGLANKIIQSKILLTSRLYPLELEDLDGCREKELRDLSLEDAHKFFHLQGLNWTKLEVESACTPYGFMPLSLRLLTRTILKDPLEPGEWCPDPNKIIPKLTRELKEGRHQIMDVVYESLPRDQKSLISRIAAFRSSTTLEDISVVIDIKSKYDARKLLSSLIDHELVLFDTNKKTYDLHPIVRAYCYARLINKRAIHSKLMNYFGSFSRPAEIKSLADANTDIELYYHTLNAGHYDRAMKLLHHRLMPDPLFFTFGAYPLCIELVKGLYPKGEQKDPSLKSKTKQAWALSALSISYSQTGNLKRSVPLIRRSISRAEEARNNERLVIGLGNLALDLLVLGELTQTQEILDRRLKVCVAGNHNKAWEADNRLISGRLFSYRGEWAKAESELDLAFELYSEADKPLLITDVWIYRSLLAHYQENYKTALEAAIKAHKLAISYNLRESIIWSKWTLGRAYLYSSKLDESEALTHEALLHCYQVNNIKIEPDVLLDVAHIRQLQNKSNESRDLCRQALSIADRCGFRLQQADIHLFLAEMALDSGDNGKANREVDIAIERASCGYKPTLMKAQALKQSI